MTEGVAQSSPNISEVLMRVAAIVTGMLCWSAGLLSAQRGLGGKNLNMLRGVTPTGPFALVATLPGSTTQWMDRIATPTTFERSTR